LLALLDRDDPDHEACMAVAQADHGPYIVPVAILSEIGWFLERRFPALVLQAFLEDLRDGAYAADWEPIDAARIEELTRNYKDLPLGIADAGVVAVAERRGGRCLSLDHHFSIVSGGERSIELFP